VDNNNNNNTCWASCGFCTSIWYTSSPGRGFAPVIRYK